MPNERRKTIRLKHYNYRMPGYYFVTICSFHRQCIFGEITNNQFTPSRIGKTVHEMWQTLPHHFLNVALDYIQVMPNHVLAIIIIEFDCREVGVDPKPFIGRASLGQIVGYWKYQVSKQLNARDRGIRIWQDNMFEHVIRNDPELQVIRQYIIDNPGRWQEDHENPSNDRALTDADVIESMLTSLAGAGTAPLQ